MTSILLIFISIAPKQALIATRRYWVLNKKVSVAQPNIDWQYRLYFTQTLQIKGFDGSLDNFIGQVAIGGEP
jgi:cellobiose phosphorylase